MSPTLPRPPRGGAGAPVTWAARGRHLAGRGRGGAPQDRPPNHPPGSAAARDRGALRRAAPLTHEGRARVGRLPADSKVSTPPPEHRWKVENSGVGLQRIGIESSPPPSAASGVTAGSNKSGNVFKARACHSWGTRSPR